MRRSPLTPPPLMFNFINKSFKVGYLNLRAQTGFGITKQAQVEHFVKQHMFDILHLQEAQILEDSFETCDFVTLITLLPVITTMLVIHMALPVWLRSV